MFEVSWFGTLFFKYKGYSSYIRMPKSKSITAVYNVKTYYDSQRYLSCLFEVLTHNCCCGLVIPHLDDKNKKNNKKPPKICLITTSNVATGIVMGRKEKKKKVIYQWLFFPTAQNFQGNSSNLGTWIAFSKLELPHVNL